MEEEGFLIYEEGYITIGMTRPLPVLQTHHKIEMVSVPSMSQEQYDRNVLSMG